MPAMPARWTAIQDPVARALIGSKLAGMSSELARLTGKVYGSRAAFHGVRPGRQVRDEANLVVNYECFGQAHGPDKSRNSTLCGHVTIQRAGRLLRKPT